jgi:hypothetical protein
MNTTQKKSIRDKIIDSILYPENPLLTYRNIKEKTKGQLLKSVEAVSSDVTYYVPPNERNNQCESKVQSEIIKHLKAKGWFVQKFKPVNLVGSINGDMRLVPTDRGVPDILCCWNGKFIAFEVKAPRVNAQVSSFQQRAIARIRECGGFAYVIHSIAQIEQIIKDTDNFENQVDSPLCLTYKLYQQGHRY